MRKFFIFVAFIICFILVGFCKYDEINFSIEDCANPKYHFYVTLNSLENVDDCHYVKNGEGGIITLEKDELNLLDLFDIGTMYGKSIEFEANKKAYSNILSGLNFKVIKKENFENFETIYGYNENFGKSVSLFGKDVNIQIAKRGDVVSVGFPIILGSY